MNPFQAHFLTNHVPVIGFPFVVVLVLWAIWNREEPSRAKLAFTVMLVVSLLAVAAHISGEQAEHAFHQSAWKLSEQDHSFL
ncbi:MAG: hypothetical protein NZ108_08375, partial [Bacteroidia bacterium]|nr:hypothetical protein [Bacteroidia bacterium]